MPQAQEEKGENSPGLDFDNDEEENPQPKELGGLDFSLGASDDDEEQKKEVAPAPESTLLLFCF
jgi:hypothetical protein